MIIIRSSCFESSPRGTVVFRDWHRSDIIQYPPVVVLSHIFANRYLRCVHIEKCGTKVEFSSGRKINKREKKIFSKLRLIKTELLLCTQFLGESLSLSQISSILWKWRHFCTSIRKRGKNDKRGWMILFMDKHRIRVCTHESWQVLFLLPYIGDDCGPILSDIIIKRKKNGVG